MPGHHKEAGIGDEVEQVTKATVRAVGRPLVQLRLHTQYLGLGLIEAGPQIVGVHRRAPAVALVLLLTRWAPSPCGRLSRPPTTTSPPSHPWASSRQRACPPPHWRCGGKGGPGMVPTFTTNRSAGSVSSSSPAASPRVRRRLSSWPPGRPRKSDFGVVVPTSGSACAAARPASTRLEPVSRLRGFSHWFTLVTPFRFACRTRVVWRCRPVTALSGLLPTLSCASRVRLPSASLACCDRPAVESFHLHPVVWRLVAHSMAMESPRWWPREVLTSH